MRYAAIWAIALLACTRPAPPSIEPTAVEATLMSEIGANASRRCVREVLRGAPTAGPADADIVAVIEAQGPLAACHATLSGTLESNRSPTAPRRDAGAALDLGPALFTKFPIRPPLELRSIGHARPFGAPVSDAVRTAMRAIATACRLLPSAIARAVQHADACSPYLPGRRRQLSLVAPEASRLRYAYASALLARAEARAAPGSAMQSLFNVLRLGQDQTRGGTSLIEAMMPPVDLAYVVPVVELILNERLLSDVELQTASRELAILARTEPNAASMFAGERQFIGLFKLIAPRMPAAWVPPGGWTRDFRVDARGTDSLQAARVTELMRKLERLVEVCQRTATVAACHEAANQRGVGKYLTRVAARAFYVAAMRLHVAILLAARKGAWPTLEQVAALPEASTDPFDRKPLRLKRLGPYTLVLPPSAPPGLDPYPGTNAAHQMYYAIRERAR